MDIYDFGEHSHDQKKLIVTFRDIMSGYIRIIPIKKKDEVAHNFAQYHKEMQNKVEARVAYLRCDKAKEFISGDLEIYCKQSGITTDSGIRYSPELNGTSERKNRVIIEKVRALLFQADFPSNYWTYAIQVTE